MGKQPKRYILYAMISILFIILTKYLGYKIYIFDTWIVACVIACLWILPIFKWIASKTKWNMKLTIDIRENVRMKYFLYKWSITIFDKDIKVCLKIRESF